ncbi:MAG: PqqD family protein [candidate division KSB1 bacterium]|nr:PqqD family protein [candidate division KSB1 bacterium]MDZ7335644.1 PqqD family protein [candidate division KSB1 bacterium]MDZ7358808.1 PqqD family protein [candidate division KSB1 bacterium]MDZ7399832.1 PqqD family protein [candidate division KSB1 bacterium]
MSKSFMKIGPITCSIEAEPPYTAMRNGATDFFTLANEKLKLPEEIPVNSIENGRIHLQSNSLKLDIRTNQIGAEILKSLNGKKTVAKIASELSEKYDFDDEEFLEQVKTFLNIFRTYKLI